MFAFALSNSGSDWSHARFRDLITKTEYPETLQWLKYTSMSFTHDKKGVFYQRFPEPAGTQDAGTETDVNGAPQVRGPRFMLM
jgi:prolyl oligopeptidase